MQFLRNILALCMIFIMALSYMEPLTSHYNLLRHKASIQIKIEHSPDQLENIQVMTFDLTHEVLHWVKKGKEFLLDGTYYDVVQSELQGSCLILHCYKDHKEKQLADQLDDSLKRTTPVDEQQQLTFFPDFQLKIFQDNDANIIVTRYGTTLSTREINWHPGPDTAPPTPPPKTG